MKRIFAGLVGVMLLLNALGCSSGKVRAAGPPPPSVVEVAPVIQKDVPVHGEWVGTLEGYVNAQIQPQVSGYLIRGITFGASSEKVSSFLRLIRAHFKPCSIKPRDNWPKPRHRMANADLNVKRDIPEAEAHAIPQSQLDTDTQAQLAAKASVEADQAAVEQATINLGYTRVTSLIVGIAGINTVQVGNLVGPSTRLTAVSQVSPIKVYFPVMNRNISRVAGGSGQASVDFIRRAS